MPGYEGHRLGIVAVGQRDTGVASATGRCGDARYDLEGHALTGQRVDLLPSAAEDEGITALQAHHALSLFGQVREQLVDLLLAHRMLVAFLADIDAFGIAARHVQHGFGDQAVVDDDIGLLHQAQCAEGQQIGITRSAADQVDLTHAGLQGSAAQFVLHQHLGLVHVPREYALGDVAL